MIRSAGIRATLVVLAATIATALSVAAQSPSPGPSASPSPAIVWDNGTTRLTADAIRITVGGEVYTADVPEVLVGGDGSGLSRRTLEVEWQEHDRPMRFFVYLGAENGTWWVDGLNTYDGSANGGWVGFPTPPARLAFGATWSGDVRLTAPGGSLEIDGMTLRAYRPDTIPAELRACRPAVAPGTNDNTDPEADGQPLAGTGISSMSPAAAKGLLTGLGLCHTFRYDYEYTDAPRTGYGEVWCDPPPGVISDVGYGMDGEVLVTVRDATPQQHSPRPQPPVGWGC